MTCEQIRDQLIETARGRDLSSDRRAVVFAHTAECRQCAQQLEAQTQITGALADLCLMADKAPARIEQMLKRQLPLPMPSRGIKPKFVPVVWAGAFAAAAALVLGVLTGLPLVRHLRTPSPVSASASKSAGGTVPTPLNQGALSQPAAHRTAPVQLARVKAAALESESEEDPMFAGFTRLPYSPELSPGESAGIVRVQMARESLAAMGVPVTADMAGQIIQADVLIGMDGAAHAIRFAN